jgi:hypothetical protein
MQKTQQEQYADWIMQQIRLINPNLDANDRRGYIYSTGFLAGYVASLMQEDPWLARRFRKHIRELSQRGPHD